MARLSDCPRPAPKVIALPFRLYEPDGFAVQYRLPADHEPAYYQVGWSSGRWDDDALAQELFVDVLRHQNAA